MQRFTLRAASIIFPSAYKRWCSALRARVPRYARPARSVCLQHCLGFFTMEYVSVSLFVPASARRCSSPSSNNAKSEISNLNGLSLLNDARAFAEEMAESPAPPIIVLLSVIMNVLTIRRREQYTEHEGFMTPMRLHSVCAAFAPYQRREARRKTYVTYTRDVHTHSCVTHKRVEFLSSRRRCVNALLEHTSVCM